MVWILEESRSLKTETRYTNHFDDTVSVINATTNKVIKVIPVGRLPWGLDTSSDGKKLFVANWGDDRSVPINQKSSISVIDTNNDTVIHTIKLNSTDPGGPFGIRSPPNITEKWIAVTMDAANKLVLINTDTYQRKEIDMRKLGVGSNVSAQPEPPEWIVTITNDNKVVIAAGLGPVFFPVIQVSCPKSPDNFSQCAIDTSKKLEFTGQDNINEPWSVYAKGDKIYGVDMYNAAHQGIKQKDGTLLIWNATNLKLLQKYHHETNPDRVGIAPVDVIATNDEKIFVSNSGNHALPNVPLEHRGVPVDYSGVGGKASVTVSTLKNKTSMLPTEVRSSNNFTGPIASIQNNKEGKPTWLLTGYWVANIINKTKENFNPTYPARFDAWINMVMLNGSAMHQHRISNFSQTNVTTQDKTITYKGTVTITMKEGPIKDVPVEIRVMPYVIAITLDRTKTNNHFGDTPIYGDGRPVWL